VLPQASGRRSRCARNVRRFRTDSLRTRQEFFASCARRSFMPDQRPHRRRRIYASLSSRDVSAPLALAVRCTSSASYSVQARDRRAATGSFASLSHKLTYGGFVATLLPSCRHARGPCPARSRPRRRAVSGPSGHPWAAVRRAPRVCRGGVRRCAPSAWRPPASAGASLRSSLSLRSAVVLALATPFASGPRVASLPRLRRVGPAASPSRSRGARGPQAPRAFKAPRRPHAAGWVQASKNRQQQQQRQPRRARRGRASVGPAPGRCIVSRAVKALRFAPSASRRTIRPCGLDSAANEQLSGQAPA
jgi:hypothetical protein